MSLLALAQEATKPGEMKQEPMRGVGDFLELTACQPGQVLDAGYVCADCALRSHDSEPVDGRCNFLLAHSAHSEMKPPLHWYASPFGLLRELRDPRNRVAKCRSDSYRFFLSN